MKLWLDDVREPPDPSWTWATTVEEAKQILLDEEVVEQSLDHDLGYGQSDGHTLIVWELDHSLVPFVTTIHSWNPVGAKRMSQLLNDHGHTTILQPDSRPPVP